MKGAHIYKGSLGCFSCVNLAMASDQQVKYVSLNNQDEYDREEATAPRQGTTTTPSQHQPPMHGCTTRCDASAGDDDRSLSYLVGPAVLASGESNSVYAATRAATTSGMHDSLGETNSRPTTLRCKIYYHAQNFLNSLLLYCRELCRL